MEDNLPTSLSATSARQLAVANRTKPQLTSTTPRWLSRLLAWVPLDAGVYRLNKVKNEEKILVDTSLPDEQKIPATYADYEDTPREYHLNPISTIIKINTRVADLYNKPYGQMEEQLRIAVETIKEKQEFELINNSEYGMLSNIPDSQKIKTRNGAPTPDDMDELITKVWKEPAFFLLHPNAVAAFGRECTKRGVPPPTVSIFGSQFLTWRGIPLIPSDKVPVENGKSKILLLRTGEERRGVVGLRQGTLPDEKAAGLNVRFMGINEKAVASYLVTLYSSLVIMVDDAAAVLEDVQIDDYNE